MKKITIITGIIVVSIFSSCGGDSATTNTKTPKEAPKSMIPDPETYDPKRGEGKFTAESLALTDKIDDAMAKTGEDLAKVKCTSCHKLTSEKLIGPGWKGVTTRRTPEWIMNFITNPDPMIKKDTAAQAMLELCLVRMPNQSLTDEDARSILEFIRKNDKSK